MRGWLSLQRPNHDALVEWVSRNNLQWFMVWKNLFINEKILQESKHEKSCSPASGGKQTSKTLDLECACEGQSRSRTSRWREGTPWWCRVASRGWAHLASRDLVVAPAQCTRLTRSRQVPALRRSCTAPSNVEWPEEKHANQVTCRINKHYIEICMREWALPWGRLNTQLSLKWGSPDRHRGESAPTPSPRRGSWTCSSGSLKTRNCTSQSIFVYWHDEFYITHVRRTAVLLECPTGNPALRCP